MGRAITNNKIKIICRVRPFRNDEFPDESVEVDDNTINVEDQRNPGSLLNYKFASCYSVKTTQSEIFQKDVRPLIERVFEGYDATIFAYGVTGSGKTYTMEGAQDEPGIIPRVAEFLFETKEASQVSDINVSMSYMEIFKETVHDLLVSRREKYQRGLDIREGPDREVFVANISEQSLESLDDFERTFSAASRNRSTASTKLNKRSSRSHAILTLNVAISTPIGPRFAGTQKSHMVYGKINLIDLAGSEDNRKTENKKDRMTESAAINKSLFVLGQVVEALNTGSLRIPFRDSKMTRILQPTLEGNSLGMMIINIAPGRAYLSDTINTLNFASRSKKIRSRAKAIQHLPPSPSSSSYDSSSNENESGIDRLLKRRYDGALGCDNNNYGQSDTVKQLRRMKPTRYAPGYRRATKTSTLQNDLHANRFIDGYNPNNTSRSNHLIRQRVHNDAEDDLVVISRKDLQEMLDQRINEVLSNHPLLSSNKSFGQEERANLQ